MHKKTFLTCLYPPIIYILYIYLHVCQLEELEQNVDVVRAVEVVVLQHGDVVVSAVNVL